MNPQRLSLRLFLMFAFIVFLGMPVLAQVGAGAVTFRSVTDENFPQMRAVVTAVEANGVPFVGLTADNFVVAEDGVSVKAATTQQINPAIPVSLLLVIDKSGSMTAKSSSNPQKDKLTEAKEAAVRFLQTLQPSDRAAVLAFGTKVDLNLGLDEGCTNNPASVEHAFTDDKGALINCLNSLSTIANVVTTPLYDAAYKAVLEAKKEAQVMGNSPVVILFTDGKEGDAQGRQVSINPRSTAELAARQEHIAIFTIAVGADADVAYLQALAQNTGATFNQTADPDSLDVFYSDIANRLRTQYELGWQSKIEADAKPHQLAVKVTMGNKELGNLTEFVAQKPLIPGIRFFYEQPSPIFAFNRETERRPLEPDQGFATNWKLIPDISARNAIDRVEYFLNNESTPAFIARAAPFSLPSWEVTNRQVREDTPYTLRVVAVDDAGNWGEASIPLLITPGGSDRAWLVLLVVLMLLAAVVVLIFALRRQQQAELEPAIVRVDPTIGGDPYRFPDSVTEREPFSPPALTPAPAPTAGPVVEPRPSQPRPTPVAWFVVTEGPDKGREFQIVRAEMRIGRGSDTDVHLEDGTVSREHATLRWEQGEYYLYDLGSLNTAKVNGRPASKARLQDNDQVSLGNTTLVFKIAARHR